MEPAQKDPDRPQSSSGEEGEAPLPPAQNRMLAMMLLLLLGISMFMFWAGREPFRSTIEYSFFLRQIEAGNVLHVEIRDSEAVGIFKTAPSAPIKYDVGGNVVTPEAGERTRLEKQFSVVLPHDGESRSKLLATLEEKRVMVVNKRTGDGSFLFSVIAFIVLPIVMLGVMYTMMRRTQNQILGGGFLGGFNRSPAKRYQGPKQPVTLADVAGLEGVKADLMEIVEFLKCPGKFQKLGGRVPKGVLLNGPPGTGKTLLARAIAGEAGVPFFSVSGSEFIQMFAGVGASRVRDLFQTAKEAAPSIIFVDEIDAVGRQRGAGLGGSHDEREQTLNQILTEMDGFTQTDSVILLAATNRPDMLDPALLRPGRFDRHITVGRPTQKGRRDIFKVHVRDVPLASDVDLDRLAAGTIGLSGADIRNIVNEAALWAARNNKTQVSAADFEYARDKVLIGPKRDEMLLGRERDRTAYHEAGHTLLAWTLPGANRVHKVTIIPRGRTLGATHMLPTEERMNLSESELRDNLCTLLGGRVAELITYNETTVGAENDLEQATRLARRMVSNWGMSQRVGPVSYKLAEEDPFLGREMHQNRQFSEHTMELIDAEVARILHEANDRARQLLNARRSDLDRLARALEKREELDEKEIGEILGASVHARGETNGHVEGAPANSGDAGASTLGKPGGPAASGTSIA